MSVVESSPTTGATVDCARGRQRQRPSVRAKVLAYVALTKPRIIELLLVTTVPVMFLASDGLPSLWPVVATLVGGTLAAASANALNCYIDRDIDEQMRRTRRRPLAAHTVSPRGAVVFGIVARASPRRSGSRCW